MDDEVKVDQIITETKNFDANTMSVSRKERTAFYFATFFRDMSYAIVGGFLLIFYIYLIATWSYRTISSTICPYQIQKHNHTK